MSLSILLLATYELGHQPLSLAWPLAALKQTGFEVKAQDLSVEQLSEDAVRQASMVGIAAPMHTALRLGVQAAKHVRQLNPSAHICFYGHYAYLNAGYLLETGHNAPPLADSVLAGEYETPMVELARVLEASQPLENTPGLSTQSSRQDPALTRTSLPLPSRDTLPPLFRYAKYINNGSRRQAGYVEASRGCLHTCQHCPITPVYKGRLFVIPADVVQADIEQQVAAGARHITFGDPDFLNGPGHAKRIAKWLYENYPGVSFDFTTKVEHLIEFQELLPELRKFGASFVVSAFEATNNRILERIQKNHSVADMDKALEILAKADLPVQATWVPFTPWTSLQDYLDLLKWIRTRGLVPNTSPVQLSIRLLVPPGSALLDHPDRDTWAGTLDAPNFVVDWRHPDPRMDALQEDITSLLTHGDDLEATNEALFLAIQDLAYAYAGQSPPRDFLSSDNTKPAPRLTEDWFC